MDPEKKVCIDPGHGGSRDGASYDWAEEDDLNLQVAYYLDYELRLRGLRTVLTRDRDVQLGPTLQQDLQARCALANSEKADLFISLHFDAFDQETVRGQTLHICPGASDRTRHFAYILDGCLRKAVPDRKHRGVHESDFYVLKKTSMPAVLVECEFLSSPDSRKWIHEPENLRAVAVGIADAVDQFFTSQTHG